jgi:phage terminase large subunit
MSAGLRRMMEEARAAGCPAGQMQAFLVAGYVPSRRALALHAAARTADGPDGPELIGFGGARGGGKSHATAAQTWLDDCQRAPGIKVLFLRRVARAAKESFEDLRLRVLFNTANTYRQHAGVLEFANGSRVMLGHFHNDGDIDNYLGVEYDLIVVEEATTLSWSKFERLRGSLRTSRVDWRPRMYLTTNPGGVGHAWFKRLLIEPWRGGAERTTRFIRATVDDNPHVNAEYRRYLDGLTGWLKQSWRYGEWDIAAGQFFTTWRADVHVAPVHQLQGHWRFWAAMDYGFSHYTVVYVFAEDGDGRVVTLAEHAERRWLVERHAEAIKGLLARLGLRLSELRTFVAGGDVFAVRSNGGTVAEEYERYGIRLVRARMDRIGGAAQVLRLLGDVEAGIAPRVQVAPECVRLIECVPSLEHDPHRPEDVMKVNTDENGLGGDDFYDAWRYGLMEAGSDDRLWVL